MWLSQHHRMALEQVARGGVAKVSGFAGMKDLPRVGVGGRLRVPLRTPLRIPSHGAVSVMPAADRYFAAL